MIEQPTFEEVQKKLERASKALDKAYKKISDLRALRNILCPHTEKEIKSYYYGGGYLNSSYTMYYTYCRCCGVTLSEHKENHGHFA